MLTSVNTMSSETRKYELKARADSQQETRERIARSAAGLHEEIGVARTTVAEIARRAGVTRLTVYNHFPDLAALLPACTAHYATQHPAPDFEGTLAIADPNQRVTETLGIKFRKAAPAVYATVEGFHRGLPLFDSMFLLGRERTLVRLRAARNRLA